MVERDAAEVVEGAGKKAREGAAEIDGLCVGHLGPGVHDNAMVDDDEQGKEGEEQAGSSSSSRI